MTQPEPRRLAPLKEACRYGHFGKTLIYDLINAGTIKAYKRNRQTMVDLDSIDEYHRGLPPVVPRQREPQP